MGKNMNLNGINDEQCEPIFAVIRTDSILRSKQKQTLSKIGDELKSETAAKPHILANNTSLNNNYCLLCCTTFNFLFNRVIICDPCKSKVCRNCAHFEYNHWICKVCEKQRILCIQSNKWQYNINNGNVNNNNRVYFGCAKLLQRFINHRKNYTENKSDSFDGQSCAMNENCISLTNGDDKHLDNENNSFINSDASQFKEEDATLIEVREHIEAMVEGFLGKSLDSAHVDMPYDHMQYKPTLNSPTNAHVMLKELIITITEETYRLPNLLVKDSSSNLGSDSIEDSYHFNSYEELLAIAIINQLVEGTQMRHNKESDDSMNMTDTDSVKSRRYSEVGIQSDMDTESILSCDPTIIITSNDITSLNADERHLIIKDFINQPPAYVVQEQIEEITTTKSYSDVEEDSYKDDAVYPELNVKQTPLKVPFPEAGIDFVDINVSDEELYDGKSIKLTDLQTWEENWLFKKKKRLNNKSDIIYGYYYLNMLQSPVAMLIPNPSHKILIDSDIDDLSDLSEHNSVCSLEFSSEDDVEDDRSVNTESQKPEIVNKTSQSQLSLNNSKQNGAQKKIIRHKKKPIIMPILKVPEFLPIELRPTNQSETEPQIVLKPGNASVQCGILVQFCCLAKGTKPLQFAWFKQNSLLQTDHNIHMFQSGDLNILEIKKTSLDNSATYSCVVYNVNGCQWCDFTLKVRESSLMSNNITKRTRKQISDSNMHEKRGDLYKFNNTSHVNTIPIVIQRTWAQRAAELDNNNSNFIEQDIDVMPAKRGKNENTNANPEPIAYNPSVKLGAISEREHKKWETAVEWKNNPYTAEKLSTRLRENSLSESNGIDISSPVADNDDREIIYSLVLNSNQKDLSRYKKDYYIPDEYNKEETLRSYDENEYSNSKYFDMNYANKTILDDNQELFEKRKSSDGSVNSHDTIPKIDISSFESSSSSIESSLPSVKELVNKFSANCTQNDEIKSPPEPKDNATESLPKKSSTRVSTLSQPNYQVVAGSLTGRSISREFREKLSQKPQPTNRISINACALPLVQQESDTSSPSTNCSPTNEGYVSDDSNSSSVASNVETLALPVQQNISKKNGNKVSRSILKRASYWEKRCEQGLISDSSVSEDFPPIDAAIND